MESDEDAEPGSDGSKEDTPEGAGGPSPVNEIMSTEVVYMSSRLDELAVLSLVLPRDMTSPNGEFDDDTLLVG